VDCVFKAILGKEENRNLLTNFLNAVLETAEGHRITDVTLLNPYNEREFETAKLSIVDVKVRDESGQYYQIEIQVSVTSWLAERMLHNWAALYHSQMEKGEDYGALRPAISIWILDGVLFRPPKKKDRDTEDYLHLVFEPRERKLEFRMSRHFGIHVLQLPYWKPEHQPEDDKGRWIHFFREGENMDADHLPEGMDTREIRQAFAVLENFASNKEEYFLYLKRVEAARVERTWKNDIERARRELEQARRERQEAQNKAEQAQNKAEQAKEEAEQAKKERAEAQKERAEAQKEGERVKKEAKRLAALLKKSGIPYEKDEG